MNQREHPGPTAKSAQFSKETGKPGLQIHKASLLKTILKKNSCGAMIILAGGLRVKTAIRLKSHQNQ